jgi:hypothetical protein
MHTRLLGDYHRHPPLLAHCLQQRSLCTLHPKCIKPRYTLAAAAAAQGPGCRNVSSKPARDLWLLLLLLLGGDGQLLDGCTEYSGLVMPRMCCYVVQKQQPAATLQCSTQQPRT